MTKLATKTETRAFLQSAKLAAKQVKAFSKQKKSKFKIIEGPSWIFIKIVGKSYKDHYDIFSWMVHSRLKIRNVEMDSKSLDLLISPEHLLLLKLHIAGLEIKC